MNTDTFETLTNTMKDVHAQLQGVVDAIKENSDFTNVDYTLIHHYNMDITGNYKTVPFILHLDTHTLRLSDTIQLTVPSSSRKERLEICKALNNIFGDAATIIQCAVQSA